MSRGFPGWDGKSKAANQKGEHHQTKEYGTDGQKWCHSALLSERDHHHYHHPGPKCGVGYLGKALQDTDITKRIKANINILEGKVRRLDDGLLRIVSGTTREAKVCQMADKKQNDPEFAAPSNLTN